MPLTKFPRGVASYGIPVGTEGVNIWGDVWFVDGTNGNDSYNGKDPTSAFASVSQAVSKAAAQDTIYVRQLAPASDATDPKNYSDNVTIPYAKHALRIIGTGPNRLNPTYTQIKGATTGNVLKVRAPSCSIENISFNRGSASTGVVYISGDDNSSDTAWGCLFANCHIRNANSQGNAGLYGYAGSYNVIYNCTFVACHTGIYWTSGATYPCRGNRIENCQFVSSNGSAVGGSHIKLEEEHSDTVITGCHFDLKPTNAHVILKGTGTMTNCFFGDNNIAVSSGGSDIDAPTTFRVAGCYDDSGALIST